MKKQLITSVLALSMSLGLAFNASAANLNSEEKQIEAKLHQMGYTRDQIELLSDSVKPELAKQADLGAKLVSFEHSAMKENSPKNKGEEGDLSTQDRIYDSTLYLNLSILDYGIDSNRWNSRKIYSDFEWQSEPYWKLEDKFGVAWADGWNLTEDSGVLVCQYRGENSNELYTKYFYDGDPINEAGIAFESLDLKELTPDGSEHTQDHSGWIKVDIGKYVNQTAENDVERTDVLTKYYHATYSADLSVGMDIKGTPSISLDDETDYDYNYDQTYFDWNP